MSNSTSCNVCKKQYCANLFKIQDGIYACESCYSKFLQKTVYKNGDKEEESLSGDIGTLWKNYYESITKTGE